MAGPSSTVDQNLLPVQAYFDVYGNFQTFIGQGQPFFASINPYQSGLHITNSTIDSTTIGATTPSTGVFTNVLTTTGQVTTTPANATDLANKFYVDTVAQGLGPKAACKCATTANITLSGLQTIDGYTTLAGDRVLVKNQSSSQYNGIYNASSGAWTRSTDMDVWAEVPGAYTVILNGGQADTGWVSTSADTGTINVTPITWVQFSGSAVYTAGTGLTLSANQFSISNTTVTAGSYGSASQSLSATVNAQGQLTALSAQAIAIAASQITSGTIASSLISGSYTGITGVGTLTAGTWNATPIANSYLANSSITINGNAVSLGGSTTVTADTPNSLTFNNSGSGGATGTTFNGSVAQTISYNTIGAPSTTGTNATGTWGINVTGNAGTVTNGVYTTGSYSNPSWLTSILGSIVSGAVASATLATTATNIAGGSAGALAYNTGSGATSFLSLGTTNYVLTAGASAPQYVAQSTLSVGSATTATTATNLAGGLANQIPYQTGAGATSFITAPSNNTVLSYTTGGGFAWTTPTSYATVTDDTTTNATRYPLFANQTSGNLNTEYTSSTKYQFNPSTGILTATGFSGSGASLTSLTAGNLSGTIPSGVLGNSTVYIGTTAIALNRASGAISLTGTSIDGNAGTATTATTATNATNIAVTDDTSSNVTDYLLFASATTGNVGAKTSSTKLQYNPSTGTLKSVGQFSSDSTFCFKNRIINGAMGIWQRGTSGFTSVNYNGAYTADRMWIAGGSSTNITGSQVSSIGLSGFQYALRVQRNSGNTGTSTINAGQIIESNNLFDLQGQTLTVSFWARAGANYSGSSNILYVYTRTGTVADQGLQSMINSTWTGLVVNNIASCTLTTSWQKFTASFTVPSNALELDVDFGYTATGTAGANDYFDITGFQLEKGTTATSFDYRPYGTELVLCQRYFQLAGGAASGSFDSSTTIIQITEKLLVTMRTTPSGSIQSGGIAGFRSVGADFNATSPGLANFSTSTPTSFWTQVTGFSGGTSNASVTGRNNNSNNNFIALSAEL